MVKRDISKEVCVIPGHRVHYFKLNCNRFIDFFTFLCHYKFEVRFGHPPTIPFGRFKKEINVPEITESTRRAQEEARRHHKCDVLVTRSKDEKLCYDPCGKDLVAGDLTPNTRTLCPVHGCPECNGAPTCRHRSSNFRW